MRAADVLIPTRFLLCTGYFITIVLAIYARADNVAAALPAGSSQADVDAATSSLLAALSLSLAASAILFVGLFGGITLFFNRLNVVHCILQFFGGTLTAWYLVDMWGYKSMWWIWAFFSFLPALLEVGAFISIYVLRIYRYA